jgi:hypothetical protein
MRVNVDTTLFVVCGLLVVVIIVLVTQNLAVDILTPDISEEPSVSTGMCVFLSGTLVVASCMLPGIFNGGGPALFVPISTLLDWYFFYVVVSYMILHCVTWVCIMLHDRVCHWGSTDSVGVHGIRVARLHSVNFMICALLLAIFSTHGTIETVITSPLLFVFMFRTIFKSYAIENSLMVQGVSETYTQIVFEPLLIALDIVVVAVIHVVGTQALAETTIHANTQFVIMFFIAHTLAYEGNRTRKRS